MSSTTFDREFVETVTSTVLESRLTGLCFDSVSKIVKWLAIGVYTTTATYVIYREVKFVKALWDHSGIAPYDHNSSTTKLGRVLQRCIVDLTRINISSPLYPLDSLRTQNPRRIGDNGHPVSGAVRDAARRMIDEAIYISGGQKYEINPSNHSHASLRSHFHFAVGDLSQQFADDPVPNDALIVGIDIDYYLSDPDVLLRHCRPVLLHTFNPTKVGGMDGDSPFTIEDNMVKYQVSGGGEWKHRVWDWCAPGEYISSSVYLNWSTWFKTLPLRLLGFEKVAYHKIHHARPWLNCPDRAFVYTMPQVALWRHTLLPFDIRVRQLKHIDYKDVKPGWNRINYVTPDNELVSNIGREGEQLSITIKKEHLDLMIGMKAPQAVAARLISLKYGDDPLLMALVQQYYLGTATAQTMKFLIGRPIRQSKNPDAHWPVSLEAELPEISMRKYSTPVLSNAMMAPMINRWEVMSESIERRVTFVANNVIPSDFYARQAKRFVDALIGGKTNLHPLSIEDTIERLNKPSQRLAFKQIVETLDVTPRELIDSFIKNEPCSKSPRLISGFADFRFIVMVSRFTFAFSDAILKSGEHNWYIPGRTPSEIADIVCNYVTDNDGNVGETDYSNLDGTVSQWLQRNVAQAAMVRAFSSEYRFEIVNFMDTIIHCPARAKKFGFKYDPGVGVKSGSPTTTDHNTLYNAFVEFVAHTMSLGNNVDAKLIMSMIGPKYGDDGLSSNGVKNQIQKVAKALGLNIKYEKFDPESGLSFLARVFVDPFNTNTSITDPLRCLRKIHLTTRNPTVPIADACCDRVEGYLATDSLTPLVGDYCRAMLRLYTPSAGTALERSRRKTYKTEKPYWLTADGSWPQNAADKDAMFNVLCHRTQIHPEVVTSLIERLANITTPFDPIITEHNDAAVNTQTIDVDGADGSVGTSLEITDIQNAKQIRANPSTSRESFQSRKSGTQHEPGRRPRRRPKGPKQPHVVRESERHQGDQGSNITARKADRASLSDRSTPTNPGRHGRQVQGDGNQDRGAGKTNRPPNGSRPNKGGPYKGSRVWTPKRNQTERNHAG
nr:MAG: RNA-dependent RNA polymerase [brine shrimp noda-like virus 3]